MQEKNAKLDDALAAYRALRDAFLAGNAKVISQRQTELRALMKTLDTIEWEIYMDRATKLSRELDLIE